MKHSGLYPSQSNSVAKLLNCICLLHCIFSFSYSVLKIFIKVVYLTYISLVKGQYNVSDDKYTWREAKKACTLATPTISFSENKLSVNLTNTLTGDVWIGYYRNKTMFEYSGCVLTGNFQYENVTMNSPGYCLSSCGTRNPRYIGLSQTKCFCLNETDGTSSKDCGDGCPGNENNVACGSSTSMSLYKVVYGSVSLGNDGNCLRLDQSGGSKEYRWDNCKNDLLILCTHLDKRTVTYVRPSGGQHNFPWITALKTCFERNLTPSTLENADTVAYESPAWIGVTRSATIYPYELQQSERTGDVFSYVHKDNNKVDFDSNEDNRRFLLCNRDTATSTTESATQGESTPKSTRNHNGPSESSFTSANFTTIRILVVNSGNKDKNIGLPVGVSVVVVVVVGIVIAAFIMIRRRRILNTTKSDLATKNGRLSEEINKYPDIPGTKHTNGNNGHNNPMRFSKLESQDNYDHTYHVLEKDHNIETSPEQTESHYNYPDMTDLVEQNIKNQWKDLGHEEHAHTYFVLEENQKDVDSMDETYNVTGAHKPKTGHETDNVYNTLDNKNHATYDHIPGSATDKKGSDSTYDSKENVIRVRKPGGGQGSAYNHVSSVEDSGTYAHVNNVASEAKSAENHNLNIDNSILLNKY